MRSPVVLSTIIPFTCFSGVLGSVFLPTSRSFADCPNAAYRTNFSYGPRKNSRRVPISGNMEGTAMAIPGYGVPEQIFIGGFANFLSIYNLIITGRILLSWIPQAQGVRFLQPLYQITDPYLMLFRGVIPPLFGLDFSPILAFFFLSFLGNVTMAVGAEIPKELQGKFGKSRFGQASARGRQRMMRQQHTAAH